MIRVMHFKSILLGVRGHGGGGGIGIVAAGVAVLFQPNELPIIHFILCATLLTGLISAALGARGLFWLFGAWFWLTLALVGPLIGLVSGAPDFVQQNMWLAFVYGSLAVDSLIRATRAGGDDDGVV